MSPIDRVAYLNRWRRRSLIEKAAFALGLLVAVLALPPFPAAPVALALAVGAMILGAGVPARLAVGLILAPLGFLLPGALMLALTIGGDGIGISHEGLKDAASLVARASASTAALVFLATTTPAPDLVRGLLALRVPRDVVEMALATYRFIAVLGETASQMHAAQTARLSGRTAGTRIRALGLLIAQLWPRALARARALEIGLAARGNADTLIGLTEPRPVDPRGLALAGAGVGLVVALGWMAP